MRIAWERPKHTNRQILRTNSECVRMYLGFKMHRLKTTQSHEHQGRTVCSSMVKLRRHIMLYKLPHRVDL